MREVKYLTFKNSIERAISIHKLRKENPSVRVLKKGCGSTRCCGSYYSALVELQCNPTISEKRRDTEYFNSPEEREKFILGLKQRPYHSILLSFKYEQRILWHKQQVWGITYECN